MVDRSPVATTHDRHDDPSHPSDHSIVPEQPSRGWTAFERAMRGVVLVLVFGVVIAALAGLAGLRTREVTGTAGRLEVKVTYAQVTRPGSSTPFEVDVTRKLDGPLTVYSSVRIRPSRGSFVVTATRSSPDDCSVRIEYAASSAPAASSMATSLCLSASSSE